MPEATTVQFDHVTRQAVDPVVVKVFGESVNILNRIPKSDGEQVPTTRGLEVSIFVSPNVSFNWYPEGGKMAPADHNEYVTGRVTPVRFSRGHEITGTAKRILAKGVSIVGTLAEELSKTAKTGGKILEEQICGSITGELAVVVSSNGSTTVTYATTYAQGSTLSTKKLRRRSRIAHYTAAGVQRSGGGVTLGTISNTVPPIPSTGVVTYDTIPNDIAATDIAVFGDPTTTGAYNLATWGLVDIVNNSGVIFTLDRAVIRETQAFVEDAGGANIGIARHRKIIGSLHWRMEDEADDVDIVWSETQMLALESQGYNFIQRQAPGSTFRQDYKGAQLSDKTPIKSWDIHQDRTYYINFSMMRQGWLKDPNTVVNDDGMEWRVTKTGDTINDKWFIEYAGEGNVWAKQLNCNAVAKNYAIAGFPTYANSL